MTMNPILHKAIDSGAFKCKNAEHIRKFLEEQGKTIGFSMVAPVFLNDVRTYSFDVLAPDGSVRRFYPCVGCVEGDFDPYAVVRDCTIFKDRKSYEESIL